MATVWPPSSVESCYTRLMQEKGLSSCYIAVPLSWLQLIHGVLCHGLSVSSRGNIGSQNRRLRGMKTFIYLLLSDIVSLKPHCHFD